jgi:UDP-GlcNAc:undecaprenyl-phosphate GlcNAc-1-phosphate transferase
MRKWTGISPGAGGNLTTPKTRELTEQEGKSVNVPLPLLTGFVLVLLLVPPVRKLALRYRFVDIPGGRKIHRDPVPLMGGAAIYAGVILPMLLFVGWTAQTKAVLAGGTILFAAGLADDTAKTRGKEFPVWPRLIVYLAASSVPLWFGIGIEGVTNVARGGFFFFPVWLVWLSTMLWVFAITNMINFIDGVDGLASGIVTLASFTLLVTSILLRQPEAGILAAILAGACLAFLAYNFYPAKIFMGDAGAIFLGYTIAVVAVNGSFKSATLASVLVPFLALGVPILDTAIVFLRRLLRGGGLHRADKLHTHHALMRWGLNQTQTVSFLYLVSFSFTLLSVILLLLYR